MEDHKLVHYIVSEIQKMQQEQAAFLAAGRADNIEEYRKVCGVIRGLALAENVINDLVQRLERA